MKIKWDDTLFTEVSDFYKLDPNWLRAVVWIESGGEARAHRYEPHIADCSLGLGQVLTGTAAWMVDYESRFPMPTAVREVLRTALSLVRQTGLPVLAEALMQFDVGLYLCGAYLSYQLKRYDGSIFDAVAAYNAGSVRRASDGKYVNQWHVNKFIDALRDFERDHV